VITSPAAPARRGRRCETCALPAEVRTQIETQLAEGWSYSRIARIPGAPSRDGLRRHVESGHLAPELQRAAERAHGLDRVSLAGRFADAARRAREVSLQAAEEGDGPLVLRAIDTETRTLGMLATLGIEREHDADLAVTARDVSHAAILAAQQSPELAEQIAVELDRAGRSDLAEQVLEQFQETKAVSA
jgi:hypothetical protein